MYGENILLPKVQDSVNLYNPAARYFDFHNFEYEDGEMLNLESLISDLFSGSANDTHTIEG